MLGIVDELGDGVHAPGDIRAWDERDFVARLLAALVGLVPDLAAKLLSVGVLGAASAGLEKGLAAEKRLLSL